jgi:hypothetical protein
MSDLISAEENHMNRRDLISGASACLAASFAGSKADIVDISKTHVLVLKCDRPLPTKVLERIHDDFSKWKKQNGIDIPHLILDTNVSLELVERPT